MPTEITDMTLGFASIGSISLICFMIAQILKLIPAVNKIHGFLPVAVLLSGGALGLLGWSQGMFGLQEMEVLSAIATGIVSGAAASGMFSWYKTIANAFSESNVEMVSEEEAIKKNNKNVKNTSINMDLDTESNLEVTNIVYTYSGEKQQGR